MADISKLSRLVSGVQRQVDLSTNTLVVDRVKFGGGAGTDLSKTILDRLISLQNGSDVDATYHTHDGRYFTESELSSSGASSGSDLIGDDNTYSNFTPSAATVKGALAGIDSALAGAGTDELVGISAADTTPGYLAAKIQVDTGTNSSVALEESILNPAGDEILRVRFDASKVDHGALAGLSDDDHTQYILVAGTRAFSGNQSMGGNKLTSLANGTASGDAVNFSQLSAVEAMINGLEWQDSALSYIADNTVAPPTEVSGDRYILSHDGGAPHADYDGASAGDIVEFNGSVWVATEPTTGMFISADDEDSLLYYWGGSSWLQKSFEATTASTGLIKVGFDIRLDSSAAGSGLGFSAGVLSVNVDDSTVEINSDTLRVKDAGITLAKLASLSVDENKLTASVAGNGLSGGAGSALSVNVDDSTIEINSDSLRVKDAGITLAKLASLSVDENKLTASVAGAGLSGGAGSALAVGAGFGIQSNANDIEVLHSPAAKKSVVVGEAIAADTSFLVRWAVDGETAGRVYKADNDASSDDLFYAVGIINGGGAGLTAGQSAVMTMLGSYDLAAEDDPFASAEVGLPVYLGAAGAFTVTAPTAADEAAYRVGMVEAVGKIWVGNMQINGVN